MLSHETLKTTTLKLLAHCQKNDWAGWDPYDALNSPIFKYLPLLDSKWPRIAFTQFMKRSPVNFRPLLRIPKTENPKAIALFLMSFLKLKRMGLLEDESLIDLMIQKLITLRSPNHLITRNPQPVTCNVSSRDSELETCNPQLVTRNSELEVHNSQPLTHNLKLKTQNSYSCWGYSFPWQTRTILVPRGYPNLVCTTFVANALLDAYEQDCDSKISFASSDLPAKAMASAGGAILQPPTSNPLCLDMAISAADYILNELYWEAGNGVASLSYPLPALKTQVHNANFLGAAFLCRVYKYTGEKKFLDTALKVARYSAAKQHNDGSWDYGEHSSQQWIDNFHTGYNLCALRSIGQYAGTSEFSTHIQRGFEFYRNNFFTEDSVPKYFHNQIYPIDTHSIAQSIITLLEFGDIDADNFELACSVLSWSMNHLQNGSGYYYYQKLPAYTIRIPYMRWSQAWMLLALSTLLEAELICHQMKGCLTQSSQRAQANGFTLSPLRTRAKRARGKNESSCVSNEPPASG